MRTPRAPLLLVCALLVAPLPARAQPHVTGRWGPPFDLQGVGIHSALLRGADDRWRVTWWSGFDGFNVRTWDYQPGPFDSLTVFPARWTNPTPDNFYECGFTPLADGRLLTLGGLVRYHHDGSSRSVVFDPVTRASSQAARLLVGRYEPSLTALPDGRVLVSGGMRYIYAVGFGGRSPRPGAPLELEVRGDLLRLALKLAPEWRDSTEDGWDTPRRPPPLEHHSAVDDPGGGHRMLVFGGHDATSPTLPEFVNDRVWRLTRRDEDLTREVMWAWDTLATQPDAVAGRPSGRWSHSAILTGDRRMVVFGGRGAAGALGDVWVLPVAVPLGAQPMWVRWTPAPDPVHGAPSARWGHQAGYDASLTRMLVFGGRDAAGFATDDCWELSLGTTPTWRRLPSSGQPREGHSATLGTVAYRRVWLFAGRSPSGMRNDVHEFRLDSESWRTPTFASGGTFPPARADHAALLGGDDYLTISGGELADGSLDDGVWRLRFINLFFEPTQLGWVLHPPSSLRPGPRAGHSLVVEDQFVTSRRFEIHDPSGSTDGLPGVASELPASARRFVYFYPPMFVLPGGHVFHGLGSNTAMLDLSSAAWTPVPGGIPGGSASQVVHYAPGRIMRSGGNSRSRLTDVIAFDANDQTSGWSNWTTGQMRTRILHRATVLPTGQVLVTGGLRDAGDAVGQRVPQLWSEALGWADSTVLDPEPVLRGYHSTALLLPDGRVFTTGGSSPGADPFKGCVFEPPYLFDASGAYVRQSVLQGVPFASGYGQTLVVGTEITADAGAIVEACLVKPSASTHDPNFEQRRVPLMLTNVGDSLHLTMPASPNLAPPGDYLLFVLRDSSGVRIPSIASWLRMALPDTAVLGVPADEAPAMALWPPWPNPTRGSMLLRFTLAHAASVRVTVHDAAGRLVRVIAHGPREPGVQQLEWDGRDAAGRRVAAGRYFVGLRAGGKFASQAITLVR